MTLSHTQRRWHDTSSDRVAGGSWLDIGYLQAAAAGCLCAAGCRTTCPSTSTSTRAHFGVCCCCSLLTTHYTNTAVISTHRPTQLLC